MGNYVSDEHTRIAIDGVQSTGKTTLLSQLSSHFGARFRYIPEAAREIAPAFGVSTVKDWPTLLRDHARLGCFFREEEQWLIRSEMGGKFIVDSSLAVIQAYKEYFGFASDERLLSGSKYDLVLYCPPTNEPVNDGFRFVEGRTDVHLIYMRNAKRYFSEKLLQLPCGDARQQTAIDAINSVFFR
jgi:nicotinamide riboside kinase